MASIIIPRPQEILILEDDFIVSKTDNSSRLTYFNPIVIEFSCYTELELLGKQHNIVRHPEMPRGVFSLLWRTIKVGSEFNGYAKNLCKDSSFYWVYATVTSSYQIDNTGKNPEIIGYFSVRRKPDKCRLSLIQDLYRDMLTAEKQQQGGHTITAGLTELENAIISTGKSYHEFIHTL